MISKIKLVKKFQKEEQLKLKLPFKLKSQKN